MNMGQVTEGSRGGPNCEANLQFSAKAKNSHDFCLTLAEFSRFLPHTCRNSHDSCLTLADPPRYVNYTYPDNNNPMQRICEEKARRILHWAFMKDCQCVGGKCVNGGQVAAESRRGPNCEAKFTIFGQCSD